MNIKRDASLIFQTDKSPQPPADLQRRYERAYKRWEQVRIEMDWWMYEHDQED